jgi:hypothetical protein
MADIRSGCRRFKPSQGRDISEFLELGGSSTGRPSLKYQIGGDQ